MSLVFGGIAPHGFSVVGEVAGKDLELFKPIREGMEDLARHFAKHEVDTIILLTPHGLRLTGTNAIYTTEACKGSLSQYGLSVSQRFKTDLPLAREILAQSQKTGIPMTGCFMGAMSPDESNIPMDWGTFIPLWFLGPKQKVQPELVVIGPTRDNPLEQLFELGKIIGRLAEQSPKKIALIASADQGHCHLANGPYGYAPESRIIDEIIIDIIKNDNLAELFHIDKNLIDKGKPDSIWQMIILYGALTIKPLKGEFLKYQVPTYFGMLTAAYE